MFYFALRCYMMFYDVLCYSMMLYDVLWCSIYVFKSILFPFCWSVPPEFLRSWLLSLDPGPIYTCPCHRTWSWFTRLAQIFSEHGQYNFALLFQNCQNAWWNICWMCEHCHIFSLTLNGRNMNFKPAFHSFMEKVAFTKRGGRCPSLYASFTRYFAKFLNIDKKWTSPNPIYHPTTSISHHNLLQMRKSWCVAHSNFYKNYNWSMTRIT